MFKITQRELREDCWIQSVIICEITNIWLFNEKKNVINKNIEKKRSEWHWPSYYMENQFLSSAYGNLDNHLLTVSFL